jgi:hypothetical protein
LEIIEYKKNGNNVILLFPYKGDYNCKKSNFYFSLYFLYLYNQITGENLEIVIPNPFNMDNCLNEGVVPKNTIFIMCDDFIYSGQQMSESISLLTTMIMLANLMRLLIILSLA